MRLHPRGENKTFRCFRTNYIIIRLFARAHNKENYYDFRFKLQLLESRIEIGVHN